MDVGARKALSLRLVDHGLHTPREIFRELTRGMGGRGVEASVVKVILSSCGCVVIGSDPGPSLRYQSGSVAVGGLIEGLAAPRARFSARERGAGSRGEESRLNGPPQRGAYRRLRHADDL